MTTWRLLITGSNTGPMNMAIDHAIMEAVAAEHVPPTLRFYDWEPPCLSLGYTQPATEIDQARLRAQGWDVVRRLTGGRAVLHIDEMTYSVAMRDSDPIVEGGIVASYRRLSQALVAGLRQLGTTPHADKRVPASSATRKKKGPVCFEVPSHYEITINEKKLVGSAQVRKFGAVLQHGSLPLHGDIARICDALVFRDAHRREQVKDHVRQRATALDAALGAVISWDRAVEVMVTNFQTVFDLDLISASDLTPDERARADQLCVEQYASGAWTARF